jgi:hypothetical protein
VGGNGATSLGQARRNAFAHAMSLWGQRLHSSVLIRVDATIDALTCTSSTAVLGGAGTLTVHRDFPGAPVANTWYPQALANALAGVDLDPASPDISASFNGALDGGACLGGARWYYGLDGAPPPGGIDFVTVVLHELGHGLGFQSFVALDTGAKFLGRDDVYMRQLEHHGAIPADFPAMSNAQRVAASTADPNLRWRGPQVNGAGTAVLSAGILDGQVRMHGPAPAVPGASVSHFSEGVAPEQLMEPYYTGPDHDLGLTLPLLEELGWTPAAPVAARPVPARSPAGTVLLGLGLAISGAAAARARGSTPPANRRGRRWWWAARPER